MNWLVSFVICLTVLTTFSACMTPLQEAAHDGDVAKIRKLLDQGVDINSESIRENPTHSGFEGTPLAWAAVKGKLPAMQLLLDRGADVNAKDWFNCTALHWAAASGQMEAVNLLLAKGAYPNIGCESARWWRGTKTPSEVARTNDHAIVADLLRAAEIRGVSMAVPATPRSVPELDLDRWPTPKGSVAQVQAAEEAGISAEKTGRTREAFNQYLSAWNLVGSDLPPEVGVRIHERLIKVATRLDPQPAFPEEARRHVAVATGIMAEAKNPEDYLSAREKLELGARLAPWVPDIYFNLGSVSEKLSDYRSAMRSYQLYLLGAPNAADARGVQDRVYFLEDKARRNAARR